MYLHYQVYRASSVPRQDSDIYDFFRNHLPEIIMLFHVIKVKLIIRYKDLVGSYYKSKDKREERHGPA